MKRPALTVPVFLLLYLIAPAFSLAQHSISWATGLQRPQLFIENKGQFDGLQNSPVAFATDFDKIQLLFSSSGFSYRFTTTGSSMLEESEADEWKEWREKKGSLSFEEFEQQEREAKAAKVRNELLQMQWINANPEAVFEPINRNSAYYNYGGNGRSISGAYGYEKLLCKNLYAGIDVVYEFHPQGGLKYSFIVHAGADVRQIKMRYSRRPELEREEVRLESPFGEIVDHAPYCFYEGNTHEQISSAFVLNGNTVGFKLKNYDAGRTIVIDPWQQAPVLPKGNCIWECEHDDAGNVYVIGGDSMVLQKYNSAGILQWTYGTPWDTANNWLGVLATDGAGNSYVTSGSIAAIQKINSAGALVWSTAGGLLDEYWGIAFTCNDTIIAVGGTRLGVVPPNGSNGVVYTLSTNSGSQLSMQKVTTSSNNSFSNDINEVRAVATNGNGKCFFLSLDTIGSVAIDTPMVSYFALNSGYNFGYKSEFFRPGNGNAGICALRASPKYLYSQNGVRIDRRSLFSGAVVSSAVIPGGINTVTMGKGKPGNCGIDIDGCGNVYVGSATGVFKYDSSLVLLDSVILPYRVFDVSVSSNGDVIACGSTGATNSTGRQGYVTAINFSSCDTLATNCCNAAVYPPQNICVDAPPMFLSSSISGGVWAGPGITDTISGAFNPALAGVGHHIVTYTLPCGTDGVSVQVSPCDTLQLCKQPNGSLTVVNGFGPYTWHKDTTYQDCSACVVGCFFPVNCAQLVHGWRPFTYGKTIPPPAVYPVKAVDSYGEDIVVLTDAGLPACPACPVISVQFDSIKGEICSGYSDGFLSVVALAGTEPYSFSWAPNVSYGPAAIGLLPGSYTVNVTDSNGCVVSASAAISPGNSVMASYTATNTDCGQNNGALSVANVTGGTNPYTFSWLVGIDSFTTPSITGLDTGIYYLHVQDANGCFIDTSFVLQANIVNVTITASTTAVCATDSALLCGPVGWLNYNWSNGDTTQCFYTHMPGSYQLTVADSLGCSAVSNQLAITVNALPQAPIFLNGNVLSSTGGISYVWLRDSIAVGNGTTYTITQSGFYQVMVIDTNGCAAVSDSLQYDYVGVADLQGKQEVNVYPNPSASGWTVKVADFYKGGVLLLYDEAGKLLYEQAINSTLFLVKPELPAGNYNLQLNNSGKMVTLRITKL